MNGPICALPDASGGFVCGEDTGQPATPAGWGAFDAAGGCGQVDALGSPFADSVTQELFINDATNVPTPTGLAQIANGHWFVSSVFTGVIAEYDDAGSFIRRVLQPPAGETSLPYPTGHPQSILFDCEGDLYYTDMNLTVGSGIGHDPNGAVGRIRFDKCDDPLAPELVRDGLNFPDGLGVFAGDLENP